MREKRKGLECILRCLSGDAPRICSVTFPFAVVVDVVTEFARGVR